MDRARGQEGRQGLSAGLQKLLVAALAVVVAAPRIRFLLFELPLDAQALGGWPGPPLAGHDYTLYPFYSGPDPRFSARTRPRSCARQRPHFQTIPTNPTKKSIRT